MLSGPITSPVSQEKNTITRYSHSLNIHTQSTFITLHSSGKFCPNSMSCRDVRYRSYHCWTITSDATYRQREDVGTGDYHAQCKHLVCDNVIKANPQQPINMFLHLLVVPLDTLLHSLTLLNTFCNNTLRNKLFPFQTHLLHFGFLPPHVHTRQVFSIK